MTGRNNGLVDKLCRLVERVYDNKPVNALAILFLIVWNGCSYRDLREAEQARGQLEGELALVKVELAQRLAEFRETAREQADGVVRTAAADLRDDMDRLSADLTEELRTKVAGQHDELARKLAVRTAAHQEKLAELEGEFEAQSRALDGLDRDIDGKVSALEESFAASDERATALLEQLQGLSREIESVRRLAGDENVQLRFQCLVAEGTTQPVTLPNGTVTWRRDVDFGPRAVSWKRLQAVGALEDPQVFRALVSDEANDRGFIAALDDHRAQALFEQLCDLAPHWLDRGLLSR